MVLSISLWYVIVPHTKSWFQSFSQIDFCILAPMISDLVNLENMSQEIKLEMGAPLKPFEQLMGCLPPASSSLVPRPYRKLMCSSDSPIIQFYPVSFEVDMNGKK